MSKREAPDSPFFRLADWYWDKLLELNPLFATQVGDDRFDDRLPDLSPEGLDERAAVHARALEELREMRERAATPTERAVADTIVCIARPELDGLRLGSQHLMPVDHMWGPGTLLDQLGSLQPADSPSRLDTYRRRLAEIPAYLRDCIELLAPAGAPPTAPVLVVDRCIAQVEGITDSAAEQLPAFRPLAAARPDVKTTFVTLIETSIKPAYADYLDALRDYRARARRSLGLRDARHGDELYAACIRKWTSLSLSAEEIHQIGLSELTRVNEERVAVANKLGASDPAEAISAHDASARNRFESREAILELAQIQVERSWVRAKEFFRRLPRANCVVRAVDPSREADVLEYYFEGTPDGSRPAIYYVNTANPHQRPRHSLASTTYHESNPGHHFQRSIEQDQEGRPALLRLGGELASSAFIEGWGLYAERLADEMNLFEDEYERLGMLGLQALRAARLVVDTGIHAFGWSRERAIEALQSTGLDDTRSALEADRYVAMPGQALAYKIGQIEIENCRRWAHDREGANFSLADFHDRLLARGSLPLATLRTEWAPRAAA